MIPMVIPTLIQSGDRTHHHDQVITPVSFNAMKRIVSNPEKPIPPLVAADLSDMNLFYHCFVLEFCEAFVFAEVPENLQQVVIGSHELRHGLVVGCVADRLSKKVTGLVSQLDCPDWGFLGYDTRHGC